MENVTLRLERLNKAVFEKTSPIAKTPENLEKHFQNAIITTSRGTTPLSEVTETDVFYLSRPFKGFAEITVDIDDFIKYRYTKAKIAFPPEEAALLTRPPRLLPDHYYKTRDDRFVRINAPVLSKPESPMRFIGQVADSTLMPPYGDSIFVLYTETGKVDVYQDIDCPADIVSYYFTGDRSSLFP